MEWGEPIVKAGSSQIDGELLTVHARPLPPGLYIVATPIGNLGDITLRALSTLRSAALVACEDTRVTGKLLRHYGINTKMEAYHDHNAAKKRPALLALAREKPVALTSDAGTPLISDPGYKLVREAVQEGIRVEALPGASSLMAALCVSGLPTDRFLFEGFLPTADGAARSILKELSDIPATLVFFESAKRVARTLALMSEILGAREACLAREITKLHEEKLHAPLAELAAHYANAAEPRGEVVLVIGPPLEDKTVNDESIDAKLRVLMKEMSLKDAVKEACALLDLPKSRVYARALALKDGK